MMYTRHVADGYVHDLAPSCIAPGLERLEKGTRLRGQHPLTNMAMCVSERTNPPAPWEDARCGRPGGGWAILPPLCLGDCIEG